MSEEVFVRHCSPTMAGLKTGNLFSGRFADKKEMNNTVRELNRILVKKGVRVLPLRYHGGKGLIYAYRPTRLMRDLKNSDAQKLLKKRGYASCGTPERYIAQLMKRIESDSVFPHEIGLFLGYPPEDVCGFIENKADSYKCVGEWKVYGDEEKAKKTFAMHKKCTEVYCRLYACGRSIERLTVAV
ncbi:MAG: DUF3793 family protein [Ruminococcus sp.]|nr:DUF3793 family protein [Ruminococcus sp.]